MCESKYTIGRSQSLRPWYTTTINHRNDLDIYCTIFLSSVLLPFLLQSYIHPCVFMDSILLLPLVALLVVAISWLWDYTVVRLIWRPHCIAKEFREKQGIRGPAYKFLGGNNGEISRLKEAADGQVLDNLRDHNYLPRIAPHFLKWRAQYGIALCLVFSFSFLGPCLVLNFSFELLTFSSHQNFPTYINFQLFYHIVQILTKLPISAWTKHTLVCGDACCCSCVWLFLCWKHLHQGNFDATCQSLSSLSLTHTDTHNQSSSIYQC